MNYIILLYYRNYIDILYDIIYIYIKTHYLNKHLIINLFKYN